VTSFLDDWRRFYDSPPLSFALLKDDRWVRFHALPDSKRYPDSEDEVATILLRANTLAAEVLRGGVCWLAQLGSIELGWDAAAIRWRDEFALRESGQAIHDEAAWPIFAAPTQFTPGRFDGLLRDIAADRAFRTLWFDPTNGRVFAPYDGGFDVFLETTEATAMLRAKHSAWLSSRADGM
jgi:hypothetical protein